MNSPSRWPVNQPINEWGSGAGAGGPHFLTSDIGSSAHQDEGDIKLLQHGAAIQYDVDGRSASVLSVGGDSARVHQMLSFRTLERTPQGWRTQVYVDI